MTNFPTDLTIFKAPLILTNNKANMLPMSTAARQVFGRFVLGFILLTPLTAIANDPHSGVAELDRQAKELVDQEKLLIDTIQEAARASTKANANTQKKTVVEAKKEDKAPPMQMASANIVKNENKTPSKQVAITAPKVANTNTSSSVEARLAAVETAVRTHGSLFEDFEKDFGKLSARIQTLEGRVESFEANFDKEKNARTEGDASLDKKIAEIPRTTSTGEVKQVTVVQNDPAIVKRLDTLQSEYRKIRANLEAHENLIRAMKDKSTIEKVVVETPKEPSVSSVVRVDAKSSEISQADQKIASLEATLKGLTEKLDAAMAANEEARASARIVGTTSVEVVDESVFDSITPDMQQVTVLPEKADLWSGPGEEDKILTSVPNGSILLVESKLGDWFRVIAPNGSRAWVQSRLVAFNSQSEESALQIGYADPTLEYEG